MKQEIFKQDAKQIVDMAFDLKIFKDHLTRDDFNGFEDLICFLLQSRFDSYLNCDKFLKSIEQSKINKQNKEL